MPARSSGAAPIAEHVWDSPFESMSNVIDVMIQRLRRKIDEPARPLAHHHQARRGLHARRRRHRGAATHDAVHSRPPHALVLQHRRRRAGDRRGRGVRSRSPRSPLQRLDDDLARTMATLEGVMRTEFGEGLTLEARRRGGQR